MKTLFINVTDENGLLLASTEIEVDDATDPKEIAANIVARAEEEEV